MRRIKAILSLFALAAVCCPAGCTNVTNIFETDERLHAQTLSGLEEQFITLDARAAVYNGGYERFEIPVELNISEIIAPIGENRFVVHRGDVRYASIGGSWEDNKSEYGIYTLGGEYRSLLPEYSTDDSSSFRTVILYCTDEYILYEKFVLNQFGSIAAAELSDLYLLKLDDMTEKRIYRFMQDHVPHAAICDNIVYWDKFDNSSGDENFTIVKYDIETGESKDFCKDVYRPIIYKNKPAFYVGDETFVSCAEPLFVSEEYGLTAKSLEIFPTGEMAYSYFGSTDGKDYTIMGYIKDGKPFNIFKTNGLVSVYSVDFADGCAVWSCSFPHWNCYMYPMFYSDKKKSVIVIEDKRGLYEGCIHDGKIYFIKRSNELYSQYEYVLVLDIDNIR